MPLARPARPLLASTRPGRCRGTLRWRGDTVSARSRRARAPRAGGCALAAAALVAALSAGFAACARDRPLVVLVGDSTTQGICQGCPPPPDASPASALEMLRARLPEGSRWRNLRAVSMGVGGSTSADWVRIRPEVCRLVAGREREARDLGMRALHLGCERGTGLAEAASELLDAPPALVPVVLGANDVMEHIAPSDYVANLRAVAAAFAPAPVLIATPFFSPQPARAGLAELASAVRAAGLLGGPDFYAARLPVDESGVHLTPGGYAAAAALWLDRLPR